MAAKKRGRPKKSEGPQQEPDQLCAACQASGKKFTARFEAGSVITTFVDCVRCGGTGRVKERVA